MSFQQARIAKLRPFLRLQFVRHNSKRTDPRPKWFLCSDAPISKPAWYEYEQEKEPTKFIPFSEHDQKVLERAYLRNAEKVEVKEDKLFEVDLKSMVLSPVYWEGPEYQVRRGIWFDYDGSPIEPQLAKKIEDEYCLRRPYEHVKKEGISQKQSKDLVASFNKEIKELRKDIQKTQIEFSAEKDVVDLGDGQAIVYFDHNQAALFPSKISPVQLGIIRKMGTTSGTLLDVKAIQRGYSDDLAATIMDSIKKTPVPSLTDIFLSEFSTLFSSLKLHEKVLTENDEDDKNELLQNVMESDFQELKDSDFNDREIDHLVLCVHGIGQILGYKYESVNFTHSINVMRSTMREVFQNEEKYQKLAYGESFDAKNETHKINNRIQTLPITWRHRVTFHPHKRMDDSGNLGDQRLPSLSDINVEGVKPLRDIVGEVLFDILLYYEPKFMNQILKAVVEELNRIYKLYLERHPGFDGKVHILGHSLGSAIAFDLLAMQVEGDHKLKLDFDVENLFCVGSPVGAFKLVQRRNIVSRANIKGDYDPFDPELKISSPKCQNVYNIFHPCDPVGYRMEPLVKPSFSNMKPEEVPFALKGFNTQVKSLTSFGDEVQKKIFSNWFGSKKDPKLPKTIENNAPEETPLGDIITTLASPLSSGPSEDLAEAVKDSYLSEDNIKVLTDLNRSGRMDYSLPTGVFSIALISAISAHVSYFEDHDTAGFIMKEILSSSQDCVERKKIKIYQ